MKNKDVRASIKDSGLYQWQISEFMGIGETTFSRMMRHELPQEKKQRIYEAIEKLSKEEV